jgi:hypothetical protein
MKKSIYSFIAASLLSFGLFAQNITMDPISVTVNPTATETDVEGDIAIKNTATTTKTFKWERTVVAISPGCRTQVCDPNLCYLPAVSTKEFTLTAGEEAVMIVHFLNTTGALACATVELKLTEVGNTANTVTGTYYFNDCAVVLSAKDFVKNNIKFYPNPVIESFQLENALEINQIRLVSAEGRNIKIFDDINGKTNFGVAEITKGSYFAILEDKNGKVVKVVSFEKQ